MILSGAMANSQYPGVVVVDLVIILFILIWGAMASRSLFIIPRCGCGTSNELSNYSISSIQQGFDRLNTSTFIYTCLRKACR